MTYEQLDRSIDADSDSDDELAEQAHMYRSTHASRILLFHLRHAFKVYGEPRLETRLSIYLSS